MPLRELLQKQENFWNKWTALLLNSFNSCSVQAFYCFFCHLTYWNCHFFTKFRIWCISLSGQIFQNDWKCQCPKAPKKKKKSSSVKCLIESDLLKSWILLCSFSLTKKKAGGVPGKMRIFAQQCYSIRNHRWNLVALDLSFSMQIPQKCFSGPFCAPIHSQFN